LWNYPADTEERSPAAKAAAADLDDAQRNRIIAYELV
jgi:hypothetical protein